MDEDDNMESVRAIKKHWEATSIKKTDKSKANIEGPLVQKTDIQVMNIIGEGIPNQISNTVHVPPYVHS